MKSVSTHNFSKSDAVEIVSYSRDTIETYAKEGQKMDVGSVSDLLNTKCGVFMQLKSTKSRGRVRGRSAVLGSCRLAEAIINSTVYATSPRSLGSEISRSEIPHIRFEIAPIKKIKITDEPLDNINIGRDIPVIRNNEANWIYPTSPENFGWSREEYLNRVCEKAGLPKDYWTKNQIVVAQTKPFTETSLGLDVEFTT